MVTDYLGKTYEAADAVARDVFNFTSIQSSLEFMTWDDCRTLQDHDMTIGSHSCSHPKMIDLAPSDIQRELENSKAAIEANLVGMCRHFCVPYGTPGLHYDPEETARQVGKAGYISLATGVRGAYATGSNPVVLERDQLLAGAGNYQHRYFFGRHT